MYCSSCGKHNPEDSKFCQYCGSKIEAVHEVEPVKEKEENRSSEKLEYGGFWIRLGAYLADYLIIIVVTFVLGVVYGIFIGENMSDFVSYFLTYFAFVMYNTFSLAIWSTTLGKYVYGLRVVTEDNKDLTFGMALKRSLLQPLSTFIAGIGYWKMDKNEKKQAWHDTVADTVVVRKKKSLFFAYVLTIIGVIAWVYLYSLGIGK